MSAFSRLGRRRAVPVPAAAADPPTPAPDRLDAIRDELAAGRARSAARLLSATPARWKRRPRTWRWVSACASAEQVVEVALMLNRKGDLKLAAGILTEIRLESTPADTRRRAARALAQGGRHEHAVRAYEGLVAGADGPDDGARRARRRDAYDLGVAKLHLATNKHLARTLETTVTEPRGFVVVYNVRHPVALGLMVPLVEPLVDQGYAVGAAAAGTLRTPRTGIREFDRVVGCVSPHGRAIVGRPRELAHDWQVEWSAGVVAAGGVNYFEYFQERLAQKARRYRVDIAEDPESARRFDALLRQADVALGFCERLAALAAASRRPVRVALMDSHFAPQGVIREWCARHGRDLDIHVVGLSVGYENYYSNLSSLEATTLAVEDLTAQPALRQPFLGGPHRLEVALGDDTSLGAQPDEEVLSWICQDRSKVADSDFRDRVGKRVREVHERGGQVFVALGKVSIDFAAPGDEGHVHADFVRWVNHLIEGVAGTGNLLLVKPHPHELREEIVVDGVELLRDLVPAELPDEVMFLEHSAFNTHELADLVDVAFLWNGTAALEFSVLGVPVVAESIWAERDYPVGLQTIRSAREYDEVLSGRRRLELQADARRRSAAMLRLMRSDHVAMPFRYLRRSATNMSIGAPSLDVARLNAMAGRDPYVERAAARFFEFAAGAGAAGAGGDRPEISRGADDGNRTRVASLED
jgi:hypothetical protein